MYAGEAMDPISLFEIDVFGRFWAGFQQRPFHPNPQKSSFSTQRKDFDFRFNASFAAKICLCCKCFRILCSLILKGMPSDSLALPRAIFVVSSIKVLVPRAKAKSNRMIEGTKMIPNLTL